MKNPGMATGKEKYLATGHTLTVSYTHLDVYKRQPERRAASRPAARGEELFDEEEEEIQIPRRRPEAAETCRPAAKRREAVRTENVPERTDTPERPVRKNVADMEKDLSKNLAKEAAKAAPKAAPAEKRNEDDEDFEFIDLDPVSYTHLQNTLFNLLQQTACLKLSVGNLIMILVACIFLYLAIGKGFEPLLLVPISFGMLLVTIYPDIMLSIEDSSNGVGAVSYTHLLEKSVRCCTQ